MRRLSDLEARTIRWMTTASGIVAMPDVAMAATLRELMTTEFVSLSVTVRGHEALAEYDRRAADPLGHRLASGMSEAGRLALAEQEKGRG